MYKHVSGESIYEMFICRLFVANFLLTPALEKLLKNGYTLLVDHNLARFLITKTVFCLQHGNTVLSAKCTTKMNGICVWKYISSPNFHRMYVYSIHTFCYIDMPDLSASYGRPFNFSTFLVFLNIPHKSKPM